MTQSSPMSSTTASYAAVDWGTSSFRLWLIGPDGTVIAERRSSDGMTSTSAAPGGFEAALERHLEAAGAAANTPVIACGMVGARQGWVEAGYIDTPAALAEIAGQAVRVPGIARDVRILPGLAQRDAAHPDVMRGEETQLLGATRLDPDASGLVCMPGTHSKWVRLSGGRVDGFSTFMTGELFDVLSRHSVLSHTLAEAGRFDGDHADFRAAVSMALERPALATNIVFSIRAGQLLQGKDATASRARLSGALIGLECAGALSFGTVEHAILVGSGALADLYRAAFDVAGITAETVDADVAVREGLAHAARQIWAL
ncbi:2-dehydro-3-deoxygalactonokinase [Rhizobium sp. RU20A]|uniref:2-dehydro-3-deoxygalactonokinase n=1 Tax=Rhizobium sp. RU20A TaxID=1907412 RepID=UPI0009547697|nr:2-dehydro-3-deoxygalactonokinase [Rhizobium sp. RU20A]SIR07728.1 2-dehydro-3-deoxygalactonokinase [Rhizobium sp. RU20A]